MENVEKITDQIPGNEKTLIVQNIDGSARGVSVAHFDEPRSRSGVLYEYLRTEEASEYLRKSVSWLVKQNDIPYLKGVPNIYKKRDLDDWFERKKFSPRLN